MLRRAIQASTSRWGGMASAIVPRYTRRPATFPDSRLSANDIARGYLDTFEPDFLVEGESGMAQGLGFNERYVDSLDSLEETDHRGNLPWGLSAFLLYREAYSREFRFVQRNPLEAFLPEPGSRSGQLLIDAALGRLPTSGSLAFIGSAYKEAFDPGTMSLDIPRLHEMLLSNAPLLTPIRASMRDLRPEPGFSRRSEPAFMLVRPSHSADIIDFWNVRALGVKVVPVSCRHIPQFIGTYEALKHDLALNPRFRYDEPGHATAMKARGVDSQLLDDFAGQMASSGSPLTKQAWHPPVWDPQHLKLNNWSRIPVEADSDRIEVGASDGSLQFTPLAPSLSEEPFGLTPSWANAVRLRDWSWSSDLAAVLPPDLNDIARLLGIVGEHQPTACSEGIIVRVSWPKIAERWSLPRGPNVFRAWFSDHGFEAWPSAAGRTAEQLITTLGGPVRAALVQEPKLIRVIDQAARGLVEQAPGERERQPRRRVIKYGDLLRVLREVCNDRAEARLARLVEARVLRQGLMVRCSLCEQENWYSLDDLATTLTCERCLRNFDFPHDRPPSRDRWAYRPNGPFSAENFAEGGYAVALALRFFLSRTVTDESSWTTCMNLKGARGGLEIDFGIWLRERGYRSETPRLVLGECKSFNRFETTDLQKAKRLAHDFPESTLTLATLRGALDESEQDAIRGIVEAQSELGCRLVVLTANELCGEGSFLGPPYSWRDMGGKFADVADRFDQGLFDLETLSKATLCLYCGIDASAV